MTAGRLLIIFAKAPVAGQVNTRLVPAIGAAGAAGLQRELIELRMRQFAVQDAFTVQLHCAPDTTHPVFADCAKRHGIELRRQQGADLGERMGYAIANGLDDHDRVALVGTDAPAIDADTVSNAFELLDECELVVQPAEDGGYVLIAMRSLRPVVFASVPWGSSQVMEQTRANMTRAGIGWRELETGWDIDTPEDLARYREWCAQSC